MWIKTLGLIIIMSVPFVTYSQKGGQEEDVTLMPTGKAKLFDESKRAVPVLGGLALLDGDPGYYIEGGIRYEPRVVGFGIFTSFMRVPDQEFSSWTILAAQLSVTPRVGFVNPYFTLNYGLLNFQVIENNVNLRTCTAELGGGIENKFSTWASFMVDFRWKNFFDYGAERDPFSSWVLSAGLKFKRQSISVNR